MTEALSYPAVLTVEGEAVSVVFPDCPGCQTFAAAGEDALAVAAEALEGWLESMLAHGDTPELPSPEVALTEGGRRVDVPIPVVLSDALSGAWALQLSRTR